PRGPRRRLARPLRAGDGARGPLRGGRLRGAGDPHQHRRRRGGLRAGARARLGALPAAPDSPIVALAALVDDLPEDLRRQALTHSSWTERRVDSYERLAFLGDSVLGLSVAGALYRRFPEVAAGGLTKIHNQAVSGVSCAAVGRLLGVPEMLRANEPE